jgi:hypothetical protein
MGRQRFSNEPTSHIRPIRSTMLTSGGGLLADNYVMDAISLFGVVARGCGSD